MMRRAHHLCLLAFLSASSLGILATHAEQDDRTMATRANGAVSEASFGKAEFGDSQPLRAALKRQMERAIGKLTLPGMPRPYYVASTVHDAESLQVTATLGALSERRQRRTRTLDVDLRVGDYDFDNSGFIGDGESEAMQIQMPIDADQLEVERSAWLVIDQAFKQASASYESKRASRASQAEASDDEVPSFAKAPPVQSITEQTYPIDAADDYVALCRELSGVFREFSFVQSSGVRLLATTSRRILLTTEGTEIVEPERQVMLLAWATTQAEDGMLLGHQYSALGNQKADLPNLAELKKALRGVAETLEKLRRAPVVDNYTGPILFQGTAAAQLVERLLYEQLSGTPAPEMSGGYRPDPSDWESRIGLRVLPGGFSLVDDPTLSTFEGQPLYGTYRFDDEGVRAQRVEIVTNGTLERLLTSRTPSKQFNTSSGHGRRTIAGTVGRPSNLIMRSNRGRSQEGLRAALLAEVKREQLPYGFVVQALEEPITAMLAGAMGGALAAPRFGSTRPVAMLRISKTGQEELVRGAAIDGIQPEDLGDILAATRRLNIHTSSRWNWPGQPSPEALTLVVPDLLIRKADVRKPMTPHPKPPVMARPSP